MLLVSEQRINWISCSYLPFLQKSSLGVLCNRETCCIKTVLKVRTYNGMDFPEPALHGLELEPWI
jgi:hypothetical protein